MASVKRVVLVVVLASAGVTAAVAAPAARISQTSIAGARLGLHASAYQRLFGKPVRKDALRFPSGYTRLVFTKRKVAVILPPSDKASEIMTWNKADTTAERIGTCSSITGLKKAYGSKLKPSPAATVGGKTYGYLVGPLMFVAAGREPSKHVTAIALYSDAASAWPKASGKPLNFANFLAQQLETSTLRCS
jgi:hypothetical protein